MAKLSTVTRTHRQLSTWHKFSLAGILALGMLASAACSNTAAPVAHVWVRNYGGHPLKVVFGSQAHDVICKSGIELTEGVDPSIQPVQFVVSDVVNGRVLLDTSVTDHKQTPLILGGTGPVWGWSNTAPPPAVAPSSEVVPPCR